MTIMNKAELRIGNLITINDCVQEITELPLPENCTTKNTKGIPLHTKEYLLNDNFSESSDNGYYKLTSELDINIDFCVYCGRTFLIELKYIHQLQNFYFDLTDKELETD